ncbi:UNVERIFIED_CONTAM: hypothetical protein Slati_2151400 [Sesamum latifolium]|uniref:Uncharacterized protein n=1 Tax=Sesamum latifolium TaxID=2727402 RepID=A0AAW2WUS0_9LAMI
MGPEAPFQHENDVVRTGSLFILEILAEILGPNVKILDLLKYHGNIDPKEHLTAYDNILLKYHGNTHPKTLFAVAYLLPLSMEKPMIATMVSYDQLARNFLHHFANKKKTKRSTTYLFTIRQKDDETLRTFIGRLNTEVLVPDLRVDMMTPILIHGLKMGTLASALARDPPVVIEEIHMIAEKYILEEEMNILKENEWKVQATKNKDQKKGKKGKEKVKPKSEKDSTPRHKRSRSCERKHENPRRRDDLNDDSQPRRGVINAISRPLCGDSVNQIKWYVRLMHNHKGRLKSTVLSITPEASGITFDDRDLVDILFPHNEPVVIMIGIANFAVQKVLVHSDSLTDIIFKNVIDKMGRPITDIKVVNTPLMVFGGGTIAPTEVISLPTSLGVDLCRKIMMVRYLVVDIPFAYNIILGRPTLNQFQEEVSTYHLKVKFPSSNDIGLVKGD